MRPNVIVFLTDQQRWDTLGVHGNPLDLTPNLDRTAASGTHMTHAFTPQPVCAPARAVLQTGQYATRNGVFRNGIALPARVPTLAHHFGRAGYDTAYIGKWHLGNTGARPVPPALRGGYRHWLAADVVEFLSDAYDARLFDSDGEPVRLPGYRSDAYVDAAIRYLATRTTTRTTSHADRAPAHEANHEANHRDAGHDDRPFLLFLSLLEPHHQNTRDDYPAPTGYPQRYADRWLPGDLAALGGSAPEQLSGYLGMVKRVDEGYGRLLDALRSLGLYDNTVLAYTSDHGCHFKTRNSEYKRSAHESSVRVPLVLDGPGFRGGGRRDELTSLVDLPPTLLDAAGIEIPDEMSGRSLLRPGAAPDEVFIQISESQVGRALRTRRWKYAVRAPGRDGWRDSGASEYVEDLLYDLDADPYELRNLAGLSRYAEVSAELRQRLVARMVAAGEPAPVVHPAAQQDPAASRRSAARDGP